MRQIVLDTETTGLEARAGHRVVEIAAVEIVSRRVAGGHYHVYLNPERDMPMEAAEIHGLTNESLADKPLFAAVVDEFLRFIDGAELLAHNADFDVGFLDAELARVGRGKVTDYCCVVDTLAMARQLYPGKRNTLDALCERLGVDNSGRTFHGALLDAELLADVYLAMTRGQDSLDIASLTATRALAALPLHLSRPAHLKVVRATAEERAAHAEQVSRIDKVSGGKALWKQLASGQALAAGQANP
jgi:DNA polymerase-3 subunit epsilon